MKKIVLALFIAAITIGACKTKSGISKREYKSIEEEIMAHENDSQLTFYDWNTGYQKAKRINKILLVDVYTDWCGWCKVMDKKTYTDPNIIKQLNKDFVCVKFNPEKRNDSLVFDTSIINNRMLHSFLFDRRSSGYPTTSFWVDPNKQGRLEVVPGYMDPNTFSALLTRVKGLRTAAAN